jgi:hypothetical protein
MPQTTLYRTYDADGRLLYVGISDGVFLRLGAHTEHSQWAAHAATITLQRYDDRQTAAAAELLAIRDEDPVWNMHGRPVDRFIRWMMAYPGRHADDVDDVEIEALAAAVSRNSTSRNEILAASSPQRD